MSGLNSGQCNYRIIVRPLKINSAVWFRNFLKSYEQARQKNVRGGKKREAFSDIIIRQVQVYVRGILCGITLYDILSLLWFYGQDNVSYSCMVRCDWFCSYRGQCPTINQMDVREKLNMKYTSEVTQTAQFILRGLMLWSGLWQDTPCRRSSCQDTRSRQHSEPNVRRKLPVPLEDLAIFGSASQGALPLTAVCVC